MIPLELLSLSASHDENELSYQIINIDFSKENPLLRLGVYIINDEEEERQDTWDIEISGYRSGNVSFDRYYEISCETEHALLLPFRDTQCELYFTGKVADIPKLFVELYQAHTSMFHDYLPFGTFFNSQQDLIALLKASSGLLAKGSKELMLSYASYLLKNNISYSIIGEREASFWNGNADNKHLKVLFFDQSYIIAESFDFTKL